MKLEGFSLGVSLIHKPYYVFIGFWYCTVERYGLHIILNVEWFSTPVSILSAPSFYHLSLLFAPDSFKALCLNYRLLEDRACLFGDIAKSGICYALFTNAFGAKGHNLGFNLSFFVLYP